MENPGMFSSESPKKFIPTKIGEKEIIEGKEYTRIGATTIRRRDLFNKENEAEADPVVQSMDTEVEDGSAAGSIAPKKESYSSDNEINKLKKEKAGIYQDYSGRDAEFEEVRSLYEEVEDSVNSFAEQAITVNELVDRLGLIIRHEESDSRAVPPSAQVYAYEQLIKSLHFARSNADAKEIITNIFIDVPSVESKSKREYFLGILGYFVGKLDMHANEFENSDDIKKIERDDIAQKFEHHLEEINEFIESYAEEFKLDDVMDLLRLVRENFPEDTADGQVARLVAKYYAQALESEMNHEVEFSGEDQSLYDMAIKNGSSQDAALDLIEGDRLMRRFPTRYPDFLNLEFIKSVEKQKQKRPHASPIDHSRSLHEGFIPSREKIEEMIRNNEEFGFNFETKAGGNLYARHSVLPGYLFTKEQVISKYFDLDDARAMGLHRKMFEKLKTEVWEKMSDAEKGKVGGDIDGTTFHLKTAVKGKNKKIKPQASA